MRMAKDVTMAVIILAVGLLMLLGDKFGNPALRTFILEKDIVLRYLFGGICILYGSFRLYRGIKKDY